MRGWINGLLLKLLLRRFAVPRDAMRWAFARYADRPALITPTTALTYRELERRTLSLVTAWTALGVRKGDHVFTHVHDDHEQIEVRLAAQELGVVLTSFNEAHAGELITKAMRLAPPTLFIVGPRTDAALAAVITRECPSMPVLRTGAGDTYERAISQHQPRRATTRIAPSDPAALGFTSGTTGAPKALYVEQHVFLTGLRLLLKTARIPPAAQRQSTLLGIPIIGAGSGLVLPTMLAGAALVIPPSYEMRDVLPLIARHKVTRLFITPSQLADMLDSTAEELGDLSSLTNIIYGTAPTPAAKVEEAVRRFGPVLQQGYGMAEVLPPVSLLQSDEHVRGPAGDPAPRSVLGSAGKVVSGVQVRIVGENGASLAVGEIGEVLVKSPTVFSGYWKQPELTAQVLAGGWMHTSDFGFLDAQGYLHILDRRADLVRRGSRVIYPRQVEEPLHDHPAVKEACLVAVPVRGSAHPELVMCVSIRRGWRDRLASREASAALAGELSGFLAARLDVDLLPSRIKLFDELPRSYLRKVLRREIRDALARDARETTVAAQ